MGEIETREAEPGKWVIKRDEQVFARVERRTREFVVYDPAKVKGSIRALAPWRHKQKTKWNCRIGRVSLKRTDPRTKQHDRFHVFGLPPLEGGVFRTLDDALVAMKPFMPAPLGRWGEFGYTCAR